MLSVPSVAVLRGVGKRFGRSWALKGINLTLGAGEILGFIGPNGAGKTTLMKLLAGLQRATEGELSVLGERLHLGTLRTPQGVGLVTEDTGFIPSSSGRRNLELLAALRSMAGPDRITAVLEQVGLDPQDRRPIRTWSLGMRQRLALAQALIEDPKLLLLDEPTNGLDPAGIVDLRGLLGRLARGGTAILLASHVLTEVEHLCHRVILVRRGNILQELDTAGSAVRLRLVVSGEADCAEVLAWAHHVGLIVTRIPHEVKRPVFRIEGQLPPTSHLVRELVVRGVNIEEIGPLQQNLEEIFLSLAK
jgi:ABC-2 type transport system ATP-binding protein